MSEGDRSRESRLPVIEAKADLTALRSWAQGALSFTEWLVPEKKIKHLRNKQKVRVYQPEGWIYHN